MKIIDEKGRFFGKINIVDLIVILILIAGLVLLAVRFLSPKDSSDSPAASTGHLTYEVMCGAIRENVYEEVLRQMEDAGGKVQLMASGEMLNAYVTQVETAPHLNMVYDDQGNLYYAEEYGDTRRLDLTFTIEADGVDQLLNKVGTQEVRVGRGHIVKTLNFEFANGIVTTCDWS